MNRTKSLCVFFLACSILFCSACGVCSNNSEERAHTTTEAVESSEIPINEFSDSFEEYNIGMTTIELLEPTEVEKYYEKEITYDQIPDDLLQAFASSISSEELQIVENAWLDAPSKHLRGAEAHIYVLLRALQNTGSADIEITSAKFVPYAIDERFTITEETFGCDGYVLQVIDDSGNIYLIWDGFVYEEVICNGKTIYMRYHIVF